MMNFRSFFEFLLILHILNEYYFQREIIKKEDKLKWIIKSSIIYGLVFLLFSELIFSNILYNPILIIVLCHSLVLFLTSLLKNKFTPFQLLLSYEGFHLVILFLISYYCINHQIVFRINEYVNRLVITLGISFDQICAYTLKILLIHKPINNFISLFMAPYKLEKKEKNKVNIGRIIGTLERIIMLFFISINQYSSIGLVLTAKSIARYDKISKSQNFAEYYLLGTLLSTISVLLISLL